MSVLKVIGSLLIVGIIIMAIYSMSTYSSVTSAFSSFGLHIGGAGYVGIMVGALIQIAVVYGLFFVLPKRFN